MCPGTPTQPRFSRKQRRTKEQDERGERYACPAGMRHFVMSVSHFALGISAWKFRAILHTGSQVEFVTALLSFSFLVHGAMFWQINYFDEYRTYGLTG